MKDSPHFAYIKSCKDQGIVAIPYGIGKGNGKDNEKNICLNNISLGDEYAEALSKILPFKQSGFTLSLK